MTKNEFVPVGTLSRILRFHTRITENVSMTRPRLPLLLAAVVGVQAVGTWLANAPLFLVAHLHLVHGMTLASAGLLASTPLVGGMLTLIGWGVLVDRFGEQRTLTAGLLIGTAAGMASAASGSDA